MSTFIRVSRPVPELKKSALINRYENLVACSEQSEQTKCRQTSVVCSKFIWGYKCWCHPRKTWLFLLLFKLGNSIPSTQINTKFLYKYKHIFLLKTGNLILNWVPLSCHHTMSERLFSQSTLLKPLVNWEQFRSPT